jgi:TonB family protein
VAVPRSRPSRAVRAALALVALAGAPAALAVPAAAAAQTANAGAADVLVVGPRGTAVVGAQVSVAPARAAPGLVFGRGGTTGDDGRIRLAGLPDGPAKVEVRRIGYRPASLEVTLPAAGQIRVELEAVPQRLAEVVVRASRRVYSGRMADFNRRRDLGFGRFLTAEEIDRRNVIRTSDLLRMLPGVNVQTRGAQSAISIRGNMCAPFIWLDGMPASAGYLDVDAFAPNSLAGIEVYSGAATVPVELRGARGEGSCGVIALWSRVPEPRARRAKNPVTAEQLARLVETASVFTAEQVDQAAQLDTSETLQLFYPDSLRRNKTAGEALIEFVVDTAGGVEWETVGVVSASHQQFAEAARRAARTARFLPAQRAGRLVRQLVQLPLRWDP